MAILLLVIVFPTENTEWKLNKPSFLSDFKENRNPYFAQKHTFLYEGAGPYCLAFQGLRRLRSSTLSKNSTLFLIQYWYHTNVCVCPIRTLSIAYMHTIAHGSDNKHRLDDGLKHMCGQLFMRDTCLHI